MCVSRSPRLFTPGKRPGPEECPLSHSELRAKTRSLVDDARGLEAAVESVRRRAREIYDSLPEPPAAECELKLPQSLYYALHDCLSVLSGEDWFNLQLSYPNELLDATPESLRAEWLAWLAGRCLDPVELPATDESLEKLLVGLFSEAVE